MAFNDEVKAFAEKTLALKERLKTEESVKYSLVMPFLQSLGYNVFDPGELVPSYPLQVNPPKEKDIDYAILRNGEPEILLEVKGIGTKLEDYRSDLGDYFRGSSKSRLAILTDGIIYEVFANIEEPDKMDKNPFFVIDLGNLNDESLAELKKLHKEDYNIDLILFQPKKLKYTRKAKEYLEKLLNEPDEEFVNFILKNIYHGVWSPEVSEKYGAVIKDAIKLFNEEVKAKTVPVEPAKIEEVAQVEEEKKEEKVIEIKPKKEKKEEVEEKKEGAEEEPDESKSEKKPKKRGLFSIFSGDND
ncbi:MAG: endonuclease [Candidatus Eremiobacterota bacterium]